MLQLDRHSIDHGLRTRGSLHYLKMAYEFAMLRGTDPSTQNGAVLVSADDQIVMGANHFPIGVENAPERWERPDKYSYVEHAERNAIYAAAYSGMCTKGARMYCPWAACAECARAIIQAGIIHVITHKPMIDATPNHWMGSIAIAMEMFKEAGVLYTELSQPIEGITIRFNGELWSPDGRGHAFGK